MRKLVIRAILLAFMCQLPPVLGEPPENALEINREILKELRQIRKLLLEIKEQLHKDSITAATDNKNIPDTEKESTEDKSKKARNLLSEFFSGPRKFNKYKMQGPNIDKLSSISLPGNPTDDQIKKYIHEIVEASEGQNSFSPTDPQVKMLVKVGPEKLNLLIEGLTLYESSPFSSDYHIMRAIKRLVSEEHKQLILDSLLVHQNLIEIVLHMGWEDDARDILIKGLGAGRLQLPIEWITAVARLKDKSTYEALKTYFLKNTNRYRVYREIKNLPGIELESVVERAWSRVNNQSSGSFFPSFPFEKKDMAKVAIQYGHVDALVYLASLLKKDDEDYPFLSNRRETYLLIENHISFRGSMEEVSKWIDKHKDQLIFDKKTKKFIIKTGKDVQKKRYKL